MRRSFVVALLAFVTVAGAAFSGALPRGFAQTSTGPQGDEFDYNANAPFAIQCARFANPTPCPDLPSTSTRRTYSVNAESPGNLRIWTQLGSLVGTTANASDNARNLFLQPAGAGDYTVTTKMTFPANVVNVNALGQTAGLLVYQDDENFIYLARRFNPAGTSQIEFLQEVAGTDFANAVTETGLVNPTVYLRLTKSGNLYLASYSFDNVNFTPISAASPPGGTATAGATATLNPSTPTATAGAIVPTATAQQPGYVATYASPQVGLFAWGGTNSAVTGNELAADFDWFRVGTNSMTPAPSPTAAATGTTVATGTSVPTSTATTVPTATATTVPTATNTPVPPTPTVRPKKAVKARFRYISIWYHTVRLGTYDVLVVQARNRSRHGIWVVVYFPSGRHFAYYESTDRFGHWTKKFNIPRDALSRRSNLAVITFELWKGSTNAQQHRNFTIIR